MDYIQINAPLIKATEQRLVPNVFTINAGIDGQRSSKIIFNVFDQDGNRVESREVSLDGEEHNAVIDVLSAQLPTIIQLVQQKMGIPPEIAVIPSIENMVRMFKNNPPDAPTDEQPTDSAVI